MRTQMTTRAFQETAADILLALEAKQDPKTQTVPRDQVPASYAAAVQLALPGRKTVHVPTMRKRLVAALDALDTPPRPGLLATLGLAPYPSFTIAQRMLGDEIMDLTRLRLGGRTAAAAQLGARGLRD